MTALAFDLPSELEAHAPPPVRDDVKLMVATRSTGAIAHTRFHRLPELLAPGDLLVINTSATLPAAVPARRADGTAVELRYSSQAPDPPGRGWWVVEIRAAGGGRWSGAAVAPGSGASALGGGASSVGDGAFAPRGRASAGDEAQPLAPGDRLTLPGGVRAELAAPYAGGTRLWLARVDTDRSPAEYLWRHGRPIRYGYVPTEQPLGEYQTVYALQPGSAEMPSAGRPFTPELITQLVARGIQVAPVLLHTGVSSPERDEPPYPERYSFPPATARIVQATKTWDGRVIAVGTTVVRALESGVGEGWTDVVIEPDDKPQVVDGLITGWHEPQASHLKMLEAIAGRELLERSYREALEHGYRWHEFGDSHLILR